MTDLHHFERVRGNDGLFENEFDRSRESYVAKAYEEHHNVKLNRYPRGHFVDYWGECGPSLACLVEIKSRDAASTDAPSWPLNLDRWARLAARADSLRSDNVPAHVVFFFVRDTAIFAINVLSVETKGRLGILERRTRQIETDREPVIWIPLGDMTPLESMRPINDGKRNGTIKGILDA
jgi:hypothetical protein